MKFKNVRARDFTNSYPPHYLVEIDGLALTSTKDLDSTSLKLWPKRNAPPLIEHIATLIEPDGEVTIITIWSATQMIELRVDPTTDLVVWQTDAARFGQST